MTLVMVSFRLNASHCLLTYSRCDLDKEVVRDTLITNLGDKIKRMVIGQEHHQDGGLHIHVAIKFMKKVNFRRAEIFDIAGYHPNIASRHTYAGAETYVRKEDDSPLEHGASSDQLNERLRDVCASFADRIDWIEYCVANRVQHAWGNEIWSIVHPSEEATIFEYEGNGVMVPELEQFELPQDTNVILVGPTGCGKSTWAKRHAPKPALWVTHMDDLKKFRSSTHKSIIFDDMGFSHLPGTAQIAITDWTDARSIHVRYGTVFIPARTVKIFTGNEYPFSSDGTHGPAIRRRARTINIR